MNIPMIANSSNSLQTNNASKKYASSRIAIAFSILIILQFYLVPLIALAAGEDLNKYTNYLHIYTVISYTIIVLSIVIFHDNGLDTFQDHFSLWTIVIACFLAAGLGREDEAIYKVFLVLLGLRLSTHIIVNRKSIKTPKLKSFFIGLLWSVGTIVIIASLLAFLSPVHQSIPPNLLTYILNTSIFQVSFVTVIEEACFRGLLFGFMMVNGYKENKALFIQAILFWGVHYLKITNPTSFFVAIPILILSTSLIIKKYKMLYLSIIVHTLANVLGPVLVAIL